MKNGLIKSAVAVGLLGFAATCLGYNVYTHADIGARTSYVTQVELCDDGTVLIKLSFTPEEICDGGYPTQVCNSVPPTWYYVDPSDFTADNYQRLVNTAAVAEANQYVVQYFSSTASSATFTCNNVTANAIAEMKVLDIVNHG